MPRTPVLGYLQSAVADNTAHSQMDKLIFEDEMSNIQPEWGTMRAPDVNIFGQEITDPWNPAKAISEGDFLPPAGMAKAIYKTSKPVWKSMSGESSRTGTQLLEAISGSLKSSLPKIYTKYNKKRNENLLSSFSKNIAPKLELDELEIVSKKLHNYKLDLPKKSKNITMSDVDKIWDARDDLDASITEGISDMIKFGAASPSRQNYIRQLSQKLDSVSREYYNNPKNVKNLKDMKQRIIDLSGIEKSEPHLSKDKLFTKARRLAYLTNTPTQLKKELGPHFKEYKVWNILMGKSNLPRHWAGSANFRNLKIPGRVKYEDYIQDEF